MKGLMLDILAGIIITALFTGFFWTGVNIAFPIPSDDVASSWCVAGGPAITTLLTDDDTAVVPSSATRK